LLKIQDASPSSTPASLALLAKRFGEGGNVREEGKEEDKKMLALGPSLVQPLLHHNDHWEEGRAKAKLATASKRRCLSVSQPTATGDVGERGSVDGWKDEGLELG
jgi:hypothetical protein